MSQSSDYSSNMDDAVRRWTVRGASLLRIIPPSPACTERGDREGLEKSWEGGRRVAIGLFLETASHRSPAIPTRFVLRFVQLNMGGFAGTG